MCEIVQLIPPEQQKFHEQAAYGVSLTVGVLQLTVTAWPGVLILRTLQRLRTLASNQVVA